MVAMKDPSDTAFAVGRFTGWEPIGFEAGDNNWYRFVANGPTGQTDPSGQCPIIIIPVAVGCAVLCGCSCKPHPAGPAGPAGPARAAWSDVAVTIFTAAGYAVTGSEIPSALEAAPDIAKALIINKFKTACEKATATNACDASVICGEYEMVKKKLHRP